MKANQKLTNEQVLEIRQRFENKEASKKELAYEYKVSYPTITRIIRNQRRRPKP